MEENLPNQEEMTPVEYEVQIYPHYMEYIRGLISQRMVEVGSPTPQQLRWAHRAVLGRKILESPFAMLAEASEAAYKQRFLGGMPMLIDLETGVGEQDRGFNSIQRLHLLRLFVQDCRQPGALSYSGKNGMWKVPVVLYYEQDEIYKFWCKYMRKNLRTEKVETGEYL